MEWLSQARWSPYAVGIGIGVLSWLSFLLSDKPLGCSTAFARTAGMIERLFRGDKVMQRPYYRKTVPQIEWQWMLVLGVMLGAFLSAQLSGSFAWRWQPEAWSAAFGQTPLWRWIVALVGGVLMGVSSRWAGGCTSGHGISGTLQLALSSWLAVVCFFAGGIAAAHLIFY